MDSGGTNTHNQRRPEHRRTGAMATLVLLLRLPPWAMQEEAAEVVVQGAAPVNVQLRQGPATAGQKDLYCAGGPVPVVGLACHPAVHSAQHAAPGSKEAVGEASERGGAAGRQWQGRRMRVAGASTGGPPRFLGVQSATSLRAGIQGPWRWWGK